MYKLFCNLVAVLLAYVFVEDVNALTCLSCDGVTHPRNCDVVATCEANEICFAKSIEAHDGVKSYLLGCTDRNVSNVCSDKGAAFQCSECCDQNLCNAQSCGEQGYPSHRGPICRSCNSRLVGEPCNIIDFCAEDEVCSYIQQDRFSEMVFTSRCSQTHVCDIHHHGDVIVGKRDVLYDPEDDLKPGNCQHCCTGDLCNAGCSSQVVTSPTVSQVVTSPTVSQVVTSPIVSQVVTSPTVSQVVTSPTVSQVVTSPTVAQISNVHDCMDILETGAGNASGVYKITSPRSHDVLPVYCDMVTDGGGWTVFQNRFNGLVDFYRNWTEYEHGFGAIHGEFWLGLKYINELSNGCSEVDLRIDLVKADGTAGYGLFRKFSISPAPDYTLHLEKGTGTIGDHYGMSYSNGFNFSTFDHDNSHGCAVRDHGGWWYDNCAYPNLNGEYLHPPGSVSSKNSGEEGMTYYEFDGYKSLKSSKIMMRRRSSRKC